MLKRRTALVAAAAAVLAVTASLACPAGTRAASGDPATYFRLADQGVIRTKAVWWNPQANWYAQFPYNPTDGPDDVATLWDAFGLFEAVDLVAIARPSAARIAAVETFGRGAERYWDPYAKPVGGYWYRPHPRPGVNVFFDDNGWWGIAFFDAYAATHNRRFLADAIRAYRFIAVAGWAKDAGGGIWWDTDHTKKTIEPLAAEVLLGASLYEATHARSYLHEAQKLMAWADRNSWNRQRGLYQRNETSDTVMNYAQGMMIAADAILCRMLHRRSYCRRAQHLASSSIRAFPLSYHWSPETDAIYLRGMLQLWATDHNPRWYRVAGYWGQRAATNARNSSGLFTKRWDGAFASADRLLTPGGTLMLLAALAASPAPRR